MPSPRAVQGSPPAPSTPFVGRGAEIAEIRRLLGATRLLTLAGPPGVGKTRLAVRVAEESVRGFAGGVWFVGLAGLQDAGLLAQEVAGRLGMRDSTTRWALESLAEHIGERTLLLVLDNCEHLVDACAVLVDSLSRSCPHLRILVTSRQSLGVRGETLLRVAPLAVPDHGSVDGEAVELLLRLAAAGAPDFTADESELRSAAELCRRLDGIPLAIELAAVRVKTLTLAMMVQLLDDRFTLLGAGSRAAPAHQRTLRAAFDWSWDLASDDERVLWRRLAVFPTSFDLAAVQAVCGRGEPALDRVLDALDGLVDKSVVTATRAGVAMRYRLLDSVREYGAERLRSSGEEPAVSARHADHYAGLCREAWSHWTDAEQPVWFDRLDAEHDNLRAALERLQDRDVEAGCAMAADAWLYWEARGHLTEGRRRMASLLDALPTVSAVRPKALWVSGYLAATQGDLEAAAPLLDEALAAAAACGDDESGAFATQYLGMCRLFGGDLAGAETAFAQALSMHVDRRGRAGAFALTDLAVTVMLRGDLGRAVELYEQALEQTEQGGDPWTRSHAHWGLGVATFLQGDLDRAERAQKAALGLSGGLDERSGIALCLEALAWIAAGRDDLERAATLQGASAAVWASIPGALPAPFQTHADRCRRRIEKGIGASRRNRLFERGGRLERADAVAAGLGEGPPVPAGADEPEPSPLSRREHEVADLVSQGLTDRQVATRLAISERTVQSHVQHIFAKLGFRSRAQLASWVTARQR